MACFTIITTCKFERNVILFPFIFIVVTTLGSFIHYSDAVSKKIDSDTENISDISKRDRKPRIFKE